MPLRTPALALAAAATLLIAAPAFAKPDLSIDARQARQDARIAAGVAQGDLTAREARRLTARDAAIDAREARMRADGGGLEPRERAKLQRALSEQSRAIGFQRHDRQRTPR
jgi:hypothetical protein